MSAQQVLQSIAVQISGQLAGAGIFDEGICQKGEICPAAGMEIDPFRSPQFFLQHGMDAGRQPAIARSVMDTRIAFMHGDVPCLEAQGGHQRSQRKAGDGRSVRAAIQRFG